MQRRQFSCSGVDIYPLTSSSYCCNMEYLFMIYATFSFLVKLLSLWLYYWHVPCTCLRNTLMSWWEEI